MLNWFAPTCPVDPCAKAWIEKRLAWLADQFGLDVFTRRAVILPLQEFFPDQYDGSPRAMRRLFDRVCDYMDVDPHGVDLEFFTNQGQPWLVNERGEYFGGAAGLYEGHEELPVVHLDTNQFAEPMTLVGTIAHELAHLRLLGEHRLDGDEFDNELLTDLTVVFHGLGIFPANVPRAWPSDFTIWPGTNVRRPEYMTQPMYGYALAHSAWLRNERKPAWMKHLKLDARASFKQGLRYLFETEDSTFGPRGRR